MPEETILGGFEVETRIGLGSEHLILLFTEKRLILAHVGKVGRAGVVLSNLLGRMSQGLGMAPDKTKLMGKMSVLSPSSVLEMDKDNFAIDYDKVVSITVERRGFDLARIVLVTVDMKVELSASLTAVEGLGDTMKALLPGKMSLSL